MQEEIDPKKIDPKNVVSTFNAQYPFASYQQQQHHQQWKDNEFGTHFSSTPIYLYQSPPHFGNFDPISPITVNAYSGYGYMPDQYEYIYYSPQNEDGRSRSLQSDVFQNKFDQYQPENKDVRSCSLQPCISGYPFDQNEYHFQFQKEDGKNLSVQSVISGYHADKFEYEYQPQNEDGQNLSIQSEISGYKSDEYEYNNHSQTEDNRSVQSVMSGYQTDQAEFESQPQNEEERNRTPHRSDAVDHFNSTNHTRGGRIKKRVTRKRKQGVAIDCEIKKLQRTTNNLLKISPFSRIVKETIFKISGGKSFRIQSEAIEALIQACEAFLLQLFETSDMCAHHAKRATLKVEDLQLVRRILASFGIIL